MKHAFLILLTLTLIIFRQFFFQGLFPFPGDFMRAWYEPWKSQYNTHGSISVPHKPIADDIFRQLYPFKTLGLDLIKEGQLPLWNPYNGSGQPLLATMHVGILNPLNILFLFTDHITAWSLQNILSVFLIGFFTYLYASKIKINFLGSIFSGIIFMLSGFVITRSIYNDYNQAVFCLPLILYLFEDLITNKKSRKILLLPLIIFFMCTVVQPQIILYILLFCILYLVWRVKSTKINLSKSTLVLLTTSIPLGFMLAAIQLVPTMELFSYANITPDSSKFIFDKFLLPLKHFITIFIPNYFGNQATYNYWGSGDYVESITSVGMIPVFFAIFAVSYYKKNPLILFLLTVGVLTILLNLDSPITRYLYTLPIPIFSTSIPSRMFFLLAFIISILAGYGFTHFQNSNRVDRQTILSILTGCFTAILIMFFATISYLFELPCNNAIIHNCNSIALRNTLLELGVFLISVIFVVAGIFTHKYKQICLVAITALSITIGLYNSNKFLPFTAREFIMPQNQMLEDVKKKAGHTRIFSLGSAHIKTDMATYYHYYDANYYDPLYLKRYGELINYSNTGKLDGSLSRSDVEINSDITLASPAAIRRERLYQLVGIENLLYKKDENNITNQPITYADDLWVVAKSKDSLPKAYFVSKYIVKRKANEILPLLFSENYDTRNSVILEEELPLTIADSKVSIDETAFINNYTANNIELSTKSVRPRILVLSDNFFPGWKAYIDNQETKVYRANYTFRAILVPAGNHSIVFTYAPDSFKIGSITTGLGLIIYSIYIFWWLRMIKTKR